MGLGGTRYSGVEKTIHNEELNDLYSSRNIIWVFKSRRMRCTGHVARMVEEERIQGFGGET